MGDAPRPALPAPSAVVIDNEQGFSLPVYRGFFADYLYYVVLQPLLATMLVAGVWFHRQSRLRQARLLESAGSSSDGETQDESRSPTAVGADATPASAGSSSAGVIDADARPSDFCGT